MQCLKKVNAVIEPKVSAAALNSLVGDDAKVNLQTAPVPDEHYPSISELLATKGISPYQIQEAIPLSGVDSVIQAYLIRLKDGSEVIMRP